MFLLALQAMTLNCGGKFVAYVEPFVFLYGGYVPAVLPAVDTNLNATNIDAVFAPGKIVRMNLVPYIKANR